MAEIVKQKDPFEELRLTPVQVRLPPRVLSLRLPSLPVLSYVATRYCDSLG
jgi:hypothetical protein